MRRGLGFHNRRSPGVAIFSPASLFAGGVQGAWYDPSDATTLFSDRAGTTPCGTPGGGSVVPVGTMLDKRAAGYSVFFDGTGDNLSVADSASLNAFGDFTIEFWINFSAVTTSTVVLGKGYQFGLLAPYLFFVNGTALNFYASSNGSSFNVASAANVIASVSTSQWYHVVVCRSGSTLSTFNNGTRVTTITNNSVLYTNAGALTLMSDTLGAASVNGYISNLRIVKGAAVYDPTQSTLTVPTSPLSPITGTSLLTCGTSWTGNPAITKNGDARVDGLNPFTASPVGNHAIAANDTTARPELRARVNLLTYSEQFDNAFWGKANSSVVANAAVAPNGTTTADHFVQDSTTGLHYLFSNPPAPAVATTYTNSIYLKADTIRYLTLSLTDGAGTGANQAYATFDTLNGAVTKTGGTGYISSSVTDAGNGWWRCAVTGSITSPINTGVYMWLHQNSTGTPTYGNYGSESFTGTNGNKCLIWGAQLTATNEFPANTYQRIVDANTYDAVGFPRYLVANGTSSAMSTPGNVNLSGTDKATVFAGVRKLSDAAGGQVLETSSDLNANNGTFLMAFPGNIGVIGPNMVLGLRGTASAFSDARTYTAPITGVLQASFDIAQATVADEIKQRINGAVPTSISYLNANAGTGNFGTYPLFIGSRNNASLFFNGNIYSLVVVGSAVSAGQISATEQWVAGKVGITI